MDVLGISCHYHDAAAALVRDGDIVAAAAEERFSREKHDNGFPDQAIDYCLAEGRVRPADLDRVVFYEKPVQKFVRIMETAADVFPRGFRLFSRALPEWVGTKLRVQRQIRREVGYDGPVEYIEHHHSHAAAAFHPSPFDEAAILTTDGVGERTTTRLSVGRDGRVTPLKEVTFPDSLGLLYSTITAYLGFMVNNDEYKVMGLAAYGDPAYRDAFDELLTVTDDGSYTVDQDYVAYTHRQRMWSDALAELLGPPREPGAELTDRHRDIAATLQAVLEDALLMQVDHLHAETGMDDLCMAGGVALNSAANGRIRDEMPFDRVWIQPAAGDAGGALGAALARSPDPSPMDHVYHGPSHSTAAARRALDGIDARVTGMDRDDRIAAAADRIADGQVVGLHRGRLEWGPRALGNRSILADPRDAEMVDVVNREIKFREPFRPFAPSVLAEHADDYFDVDGDSPYMLFVVDVHEGKRDEIPAVTHVDGTSRIQTVRRETSPFYYDLIDAFRERTGVPVVLNTSFNRKGEPIVNTPAEACDCFMDSGMDAMVLDRFLVEKRGADDNS